MARTDRARAPVATINQAGARRGGWDSLDSCISYRAKRLSAAMTINDSVRNQLQAALQVRTSGEAARWLQDALTEAQTGPVERLLSIYTEASMRLGRLPLSAPNWDSFTASPEGLALDRWTLEDAARATFLLARADNASPE